MGGQIITKLCARVLQRNSNTVDILAKFVLNKIQDFKVLIGRITGHIDFPVPPNSSMLKTSSKTIRHYFESGIRTYLPISTAALHEGIDLNSNLRILDFGCGVGRQLLHFVRHYPQPSYFACDIDQISIKFIAKNYPEVEATVNSFTPPLNYPDSFFDMIYSVSIFSHLNIADQRLWLDELARITKIGGYCFLTTEGYTALGSLQRKFGLNTSELGDKLRTNGYLYEEYKDWESITQNQERLGIANNLAGVERSYGNMVVSPDFVREQWQSQQFDVIGIIEGIIDHRQDLIILRRTKSG